MVGPLDGVRVLELPAIGPVPFLGMLLSDLGATVIRIDRPAGTATPETRLPDGALQRGRQVITLDLREPAAVNIVLELAERSEVLIEGFRPGVAERLGIGPDPALAANPALVYARLTGWGQDGPLAHTAGHDINYLAISGALHGIGERDRPIPPINYLADLGGGSMIMATGILAALLQAQRTGRGQVVDTAMTEGAAYLTTITRQLLINGLWSDERGANLLDGGAPNYRCYRCADGRFVAVGAMEPKFWQELIMILGGDPSGVPSPYDRNQWPACADWLAERFAARSRDEWAETFAGTDACVSPVLTLAEAPEHPHNRARGTFTGPPGAEVPAPVPRFLPGPTT